MDSKAASHAGRPGEARTGHALVVVGDLPEQSVTVVNRAAHMAGEVVHRESTVERALAWMDKKGVKPTAITLALEPEGAARDAIAVRQNMALAALPIIGLTRMVNDLAFEEVFASGVDDVCAVDELRLARRLRQLEEVVAPSEVARREDAVIIADPGRDTRLLIGRVFRDAGYAVSFALDSDEALRHSLEPKTLAVIASSEIDKNDGDPLPVRAASAGCRAAWIINTPPKDMPAVGKRLSVLAAEVKITIHDAFAAPATLLFVTNELINKPAKDGRKSARVLYGTSVRFRLAGRENDDIGYMYNISEGGMYVRTLAPPQRWDELWLEFVPPRSDRRVHIEGTAVWARRFGPSSSASVPPGFGVQITGGSKGDLERYEKCYRTFLTERISSRDSIMPPSMGGG